MTARNILVTEDELHAYVDHELSAKRRQVVRAWLASRPDGAASARGARRARHCVGAMVAC